MAVGTARTILGPRRRVAHQEVYEMRCIMQSAISRVAATATRNDAIADN